MANGFCPYLLQHIASIAGTATPQYKVNAHGFLEMLVKAGNPNSIKVGNYDGHKKTVQVSYRQRFTKQQTDTALSCDQVNIPAKLEGVVSVANVRQLAIQLDDELVAQYCNDASAMTSLQGAVPTSSVMNEVADIIFSGANALLQGVNEDVIGLLTWGKNVVSGNNAAVTVNMPADVSVQPLAGGMTKILSDYKQANLSSRPQVVGSGLMLGYVLQQAWKSPDFAGMDSKIATGMIDFYNDQDFATAVGTNHFGVFEPGAVQLVQYLQNTGFQAGEKPDGSFFGILPLPMVDPTNNMVVPVMFDYQFKYSSCPQTLTNAYTGSPVTVQKGWSIILSKQFGLWQIYNDAFRGEDPSSGVNGALHYIASNDCDTCS
jgi:hypothetical protein